MSVCVCVYVIADGLWCLELIAITCSYAILCNNYKGQIVLLASSHVKQAPPPQMLSSRPHPLVFEPGAVVPVREYHMALRLEFHP